MECEGWGNDVIIILSEKIAFVRSDGGGRNTKATGRVKHSASVWNVKDEKVFGMWLQNATEASGCSALA